MVCELLPRPTLLIFAVVGPQLSDDVHNKVFTGNFQSPEGILTKLTKTIRELSIEKKALCTVRKQSMPVCIERQRSARVKSLGDTLMIALKHISLGLEVSRVEILVVVVLFFRVVEFSEAEVSE